MNLTSSFKKGEWMGRSFVHLLPHLSSSLLNLGGDDIVVLSSLSVSLRK